MKTNELIYDKALKKMLFEYIEKLDGFIINTSGYPTSNCQTKGEVNDVFFKKLNTTKIKKLYSGDYLSLFNEYYNLLQGKVKTNKIIALLYKDNDIFEFSQLIAKEKFLDNANIFQWDDISNLFDIILLEINACVNYNKSSKIMLGIETAIWNFTIDGILFDLDPPKILKKTEDTSFTRKEDINHIKRTIYRSFDETGMKINLLVTLILGEKHNSFIIKNKPDNYLIILLKKILDSYTKEDDRKNNFFNLFINGVSVSSDKITFSAILPNSVSIPVAMAIPFPLPFVITLPANAIFFLSASSVFLINKSVFLDFGIDSPVKIDSFISKFLVSISLISAGTFAPVSKSIISPTTTSSELISFNIPSLITLVFIFIIFCNFSALFSELHS